MYENTNCYNSRNKNGKQRISVKINTFDSHAGSFVFPKHFIRKKHSYYKLTSSLLVCYQRGLEVKSGEICSGKILSHNIKLMFQSFARKKKDNKKGTNNQNRERRNPLKKAQHDKTENVAGSIC
jgi:hypothetical protein